MGSEIGLWWIGMHMDGLQTEFSPLAFLYVIGYLRSSAHTN